MNLEYLQHIALAELSSTYSYKILLLLLTKEYTQSQLCSILNIKKQNILKYIKELEHLNLIEVDRIEGRNKFYKAITDLEKLPTNILKL
ncbi:winged helix-turn-helix transcriptional regulator (plasmid) [Clostridium botulinum]|uniref:winged helix-turn-helix domain-containing protein n=1 Tax=Clostridium botulinum TaxID=1491 RepID=UPI0007748DFC|nr:winged helix-turn-helix domain-containing protein [Clostridium botulinum]NFL88141.1 winged helix-turn-helix transcriptional regulator [Clostridium botulinum]NFO22866.1 winged helix-turn-helix transcriptional regulator [Clostridium botulinum]UZP05173.1 winged helix-turn-helix transcriptional regulator [Clostridium botulinum]UZP08561.1 winged helix-turn-helix transcriptional regulator [Clostridium botulinum]UZP11926.1 winged helix-turn-helix transcriptional regulator [Clostridium botulinum]